jgi:hypothetical protein
MTRDEVSDVDIGTLKGRFCRVQIEHNDDGRAKIVSFHQLRKGEDDLPVSKAEFFLDLTSKETFNEATYNSLPDWFRERIAESPQYAEVTGRPQKPQAGRRDPVTQKITDDEIPF